MRILRRLGAKVKEAIKRKKSGLELKQKSKKEPVGGKPVSRLGAQEEVAISTSKFYHPETHKVAPRQMPSELSDSYGKDKIVLQVRDPWWLHAYWEVTESALDRLKGELKEGFWSAKCILRVYDVSLIILNGSNAHRFFDIEVGTEAHNWYIDTVDPGKSWCVDFGLRLSDGRFITIVRSNTVSAPIAGPSWITDEEWMIPDDLFARLYGMGFGFGRSSPVGKGWQEKIAKQFISSSGFASMASPVKVLPKERKFFLTVNTELIVYGATEPEAKVFVQDRQIPLRTDGTFSFRFALPDGRQTIPVKGVSADGLEERTITPIVSKETR